MKHKVILEIDGVRHKLIKTRSATSCEKCSINTFENGACICGNIIDDPCIGFRSRFRKCKPGE